MKFSSSELHFFELARKEAAKSCCNWSLGCVITYKHTILAKGYNTEKSTPMQLKYNSMYRVLKTSYGSYIPTSTHAEISALTGISKKTLKSIDMSKTKIFIYRITRGGNKGLSKPCNSCIHAIYDYGIRHIYYTDRYGYAYLDLTSSDYFEESDTD